MIPGYAGTTLYVDLTHGKIRKEPLDPEMVRLFIGGHGINNRLAYDLIPPSVDPFSPENAIIIGAGPFAGTLIPGSGKVVVTTRSPLNGSFVTGAGGGSFALMLKTAGYDHVVIQGRAEKPVYLRIGDKVELLEARDLWGKNGYDTVDALRQRHEPCSVIAIGPAGEHLVRISETTVDKDGSLGRGGMPAVMGSKNLKAVVAEKGLNDIRIADRARLMRVVEILHRRIMGWPGQKETIKMGIGGLVSKWWPGDKDPLSSTAHEAPLAGSSPLDREALQKMYLECRKVIACPSCPVGDKERVRVPEGKYAGLLAYGNSAWPGRRYLGGQTLAEELARAGQRENALNSLGLDSMNTSYLLSFVTYLYRKGILTGQDTGGLELTGDFEMEMKLLRMIAYREGFGDVLADGIVAAAQRIGKGAEREARHIKGLALVWDPRPWGLNTMAFDQLVNPRGAHVAAGGSATYMPERPLENIKSHAQRMGVPEEAMERIFGPTDFNVGRLTRYSEDWFALFNSLSLCLRAQVNRFYTAPTLAELYSALTGIETSPAELMKAAERVWNISRLLNARAGFGRKDDRPPDYWFEPLKRRGKEFRLMDYFNTAVLSREDVERLLDDYYDERGYDPGTGNPTAHKVSELGLEGV